MNVSTDTWTGVHSDPLPAIVWTASSRVFNDEGYTYAAFYATKLKTWFLAGNAVWYGQREVTDIQMLEILSRDEVTAMWAVDKWAALYE